MLQKHVCCHFTEEQQRLSVSAGSLPSVSLNSTPVHIFQTTTSESPVPQVLMPSQPKICECIKSYNGTCIGICTSFIYGKNNLL